MRLYQHLLAALILFSSHLVLAQSPVIEDCRAKLQSMMDEEGIVGLSVTLSFKDSVIWSEGLGHRDLQGTKSISPSETLFRIASLSKPITATIMGRLYEDSIIDVEESLYTYAPDFPKKAYDFSLRDLAMHRSGIRHYKPLETENTKAIGIKEGLERFKSSKLKFKPGSSYLYSSYGYNLLGYAMSNASKVSFEDLMETYICTPLDMKHTMADRGTYPDMNVSGFFQTKGKDKTRIAKDVNMYMKLPSGGILSTSEDLVKLGNAYIYKRAMRPETQAEILRLRPFPEWQANTYAMGWGVSKDKQGRTYWSHTGGNTGAMCRILVYPEQEMCLAIVSNTSGADYLKFIRIMAQVANAMLEEYGQ